MFGREVCNFGFSFGPFKDLKSPDLTNDDRKEIYQLARSLMSHISLPPSIISPDKEHAYGQASKRSKSAALEDEFLDWQCDEDATASNDDEVNEYLSTVFSNQNVMQDCVQKMNSTFKNFGIMPPLRCNFQLLAARMLDF